MTDSERPEDSPQESLGAEADGTRGDEAAELAPEDWAESPELGWSEASEQEMAVCRETLRRIERMIAIAGAVCALAAIWPLGWAVAAGMLVGTALGWLNFRWLAASVNAIGDRIVKAKSQELGATVMARGVGRIVLIALVAYGIFAYSVRGLMGFLAGLAMPVIAMMCEAVYEFVASSRRPS
jgi:ATP synthase I chain